MNNKFGNSFFHLADNRTTSQISTILVLFVFVSIATIPSQISAYHTSTTTTTTTTFTQRINLSRSSSSMTASHLHLRNKVNIASIATMVTSSQPSTTAATALFASSSSADSASMDGQPVMNLQNKNQNKNKKVAIIGGGIAGLACARELSRLTSSSSSSTSPWDITVYDTGRLRPGGRCSSRRQQDVNKKSQQQTTYPILSKAIRFYDHAAQLIVDPSASTTSTTTSTNNTPHLPAFTEQVKVWKASGILKALPFNSVCQIETNGKITPLNGENSEDTTTFYYVPQGGMGSLALDLAKTVHIQQDVWVPPSSGIRYQKKIDTHDDNGKQNKNHNNKNKNNNNTNNNNKKPWKLKLPNNANNNDNQSKNNKNKKTGNGNGSPFTPEYDQLIIAHNGKCADRIMSKTPAKALHSLLRVNFAPTVPAHGGKKMTLNSLYSWTIVIRSKKNDDIGNVLAQALPEPFICGFTQHPKLRMISSQTRKFATSNNIDDDENGNEKEHNYEVWNILSSPKFAKQFKGPQEFLPEELQDEVTTLLMEAVSEVCHFNEAQRSEFLTSIVESRLQLWGAAVPLNVWSDTTSKKDKAAVPSQFIWDDDHQVGVCGDWLVDPSIGGAYESGTALARHIVEQEYQLGTSKSHGLPFDDNKNKNKKNNDDDDNQDNFQFQRSQGAQQLGLAALSSKALK